MRFDCVICHAPGFDVTLIECPACQEPFCLTNCGDIAVISTEYAGEIVKYLCKGCIY